MGREYTMDLSGMRDEILDELSNIKKFGIPSNDEPNQCQKWLYRENVSEQTIRYETEELRHGNNSYAPKLSDEKV